jgi:pimeloyl-ACP methyl ester carboxylesterase
MGFRTTASTLFHRYLKVPFTLNVYEFQSPKRPKATYVLLHGIGNTLHSWDEVVKAMPRDVRIIGIDLLGFGASPKPQWAIYNAKTQARSVGATLLGLHIAQRPILVGHSLGALVAVEVAKRYPLIPKQLVLCSPPFYSPPAPTKRIKPYDDRLRQLYRIAKNHPDQLAKYSSLAVKMGIANKSLSITTDNVASYLGALEASIINQTALHDVTQLKLPITIFYGMFDAVVIKKHITTLAKQYETITAKRLMLGHEITGLYVNAVADFLATLVPKR